VVTARRRRTGIDFRIIYSNIFDIPYYTYCFDTYTHCCSTYGYHNSTSTPLYIQDYISPSVNKFISQNSTNFFLFESSEILLYYSPYNIGAQLEDTPSVHIAGSCVYDSLKIVFNRSVLTSSSLFVYKNYMMERKLVR